MTSATLTPPRNAGKAQTFSEGEIRDFVAHAKARDAAGKNWSQLFTQSPDAAYEVYGDHITLKLLANDESVLGLDARIDAVLKQHNEKAAITYRDASEADKKRARMEYSTFERDPINPQQLIRFLGGTKQNKATKLIQFLQNIDEAEPYLLAHDLSVEWGAQKADKAPAQPVAKQPVTFAALQNQTPLAADTFDTSDLRVVISRDAVDIASMSTGRRWTSCTSKEGVNYDYVPKEIEAGTLVAYLVHKDDKKLKYPLARVLLKPFHSETGETILVPNHVYSSDVAGNSATNDALLHTVQSFVSTWVNHGKSGTFKMAEGIYSDAQETTLNMGERLQGEALAKAIAGSIADKIKEFITEIEAAHEAKNTGLVAIYTKKLADLFAEPKRAAMTYMRNLRDMHIGQALPTPSDVIAAMGSETVKEARNAQEIVANLYVLGKAGWAAYMDEQHPDMAELNVSRNCIGTTGAQALAANKTITSLNVSDNHIGYVGAQALAANTTLTSLDLASNNIGYVGAQALAANTTLTSLDVSGNGIGYVGAQALAANTTLTSLDVSHNYIRYAGAQALAANTTLTSLNMTNNQIRDEGVKALAKNTTLTSLNVSDNHIGTTGAQALAANTTLTSLYVSGNGIGEIGAQALATGLRNNKNILNYEGMDSDVLDNHLKENRKQAEHYARQFAGDGSIADGDKPEIRARANAIRYMLTNKNELPDLDTEQKQKALQKLDTIQAEAGLAVGRWTKFASDKKPRALG